MLEDKRALRKRILALRDALPAETRETMSRQMMNRLFSMAVYTEADSILTYVNYRSEVNTTDLVNRALADEKRVFAPRVSGETMDFYQISGIEDLQEGYRGIREPAAGREAFGTGRKNEHTLMLMPGAVFDEKCHRIGYGKGFYDRYISRMEENGVFFRTLALCFECQLLQEIPYEKHDIRPQYVLAERRLIRSTEGADAAQPGEGYTG